MVIFTARQNLANLNEVKINLIVKFANLAGKSYIYMNLEENFSMWFKTSIKTYYLQYSLMLFHTFCFNR